MKYFLFITLISFALYGDILENKIENLIGNNNFIKHKNLIKSLTSNKNRFYIGDKINYSQLLGMLNKNGFLNIRFAKPQTVTITFVSHTTPLKTMKILKEILSNLGYMYYFTNYMKYQNGMLKWQIYFKSEYMLDPYIFNKELALNESSIVDIVKISNKQWEYHIDTHSGILADAKKIEKDEKIYLKKPLKPYLLRIGSGEKLVIRSRKLNHWYPMISVFDKDLNLLKTIKKNRIYKGFTLELPQNSYYIKLEDSFALLNIKRGLTIILR